VFLTGVTEADPALATYEQAQGSVALRALLTDGSAFCAFLQRGGGIDNAMIDLAVGARSVEAQTHLPSSVTTFTTVEAVALLTLCPSYQSLLPAQIGPRSAISARLSPRGRAEAEKSDAAFQPHQEGTAARQISDWRNQLTDGPRSVHGCVAQMIRGSHLATTSAV
jgi:hypothetical protein